MTAVALDGVVKRYGGVTAVDGIDLQVGKGEFLTLLGPSGCGKSTTLQMIAGFVLPSAGRIRIGGRDSTRLPPHRRNVGMVFQNYALFPHMTLADNVAFGLRMRGVAKAERRRRAGEALAVVQLTGLADRYPGQISGGQQQRVALARALVIQPDVLLLDEPFGALDKQLRDRMRIELRDLQRQLGISLIFVTHDQEEALSMSDRIAVLSEGRIRQLGTPDGIYRRPANRFVAEFMGHSNILPARVVEASGDRALVRAGGLLLAVSGRLSAGGDIELMIRPERIGIGPADAGAAIRGRVAGMQYLGASLHYRVVVEGGTELSVVTPDPGEGRRVPGDPVALAIPDGAPFVIGS